MKCLLLVLVAAACANVQAGYVQLHRILSVEPERIERGMADYPEAFRDGFILAAFSPEMKRPKMVGSKGQVAKAMACPRSAAFKADLAQRLWGLGLSWRFRRSKAGVSACCGSGGATRSG